ncbi:MAG TPA: bifunctional glutamate N-acetyltransferase/amino-acid acetyltransferase ArgJ [Kofleriaceae bacterium]|nr:bifunctional glutamate N-acetyltransferase/amino-acid acetyltransferase ArgJ [Kofleriaceae bacterium]
MDGVRGFRFAGVAAGIKQKGGPDVGLIVADQPCAAAAVFTRNRVPAAPVVLSRAALKKNKGRARALVVNSGNANALTGDFGRQDAERMAAWTAELLGADQRDVLVASTGVIGVRLPMEHIESGISLATENLEEGNFDRFATAILTTDRAAKIAQYSVDGARLLGCTKGAGMIAPNMATTLTFVVTDANLAPGPLARELGQACDSTFNSIAVDGDTSTNDMILVMASGVGPRVSPGAFGGALEELLANLARQLMHGGEGVHHVVAVEVRGASTTNVARKVARAIAISPLVKTAIAGADPNFGRILAAAGNAGVGIKPARLALDLDDVPIVRGGVPVDDPQREARARDVMGRLEYSIRVDLGTGRAFARYLACDLSHEYVTINADYRT